MTQNLNALTRHPLHASVLESFNELQMAPTDQQASFTATLSRILTEAFIRQDPDFKTPAFLTDAGVSIIRMEMQDIQTQCAPDSEEPIGDVIGRWHDVCAENPAAQSIAVSGDFALCAPFKDIPDLLDHPVLQQGGTLGFFDPIYDDSLILIRVKASSQAEWHLRLLGNTVVC